MTERLKPGDLRQHLGDLLDRVEARRHEFVIERRGKPLAALMPFDRYQRFQRAAELDLIDLLDRHARQLTRRQARDLVKRAKTGRS